MDPAERRWQSASLLRRRGALVAVFSILVAVLRLPSLFHQLFDPDEAAISAQAIGLVRGGTMYVDAIDRKPPLPPFIYAASHWLTGDTDLRLLHIVAGILLVGAAVAIAREARRLSNDAAMWWGGALMATAALAMLPVDGQSANYAHFALAPGAVAMVAARRGTDRSALLAGFALALATLCRQTWAIGVIPAAVAIMRFGDWRRHLPLAFVGGIIPIAGVALVVPWDEFVYWTFSSNGSFVLGGADIGHIALRGFLMSLLFIAGHTIVLWFAGAGLRRRSREHIDVLLWLATGMVAVVAGYRFWGHYWFQTLPPLALLAAIELGERDNATQRRAAQIVAATAILAFALAWAPDMIRPMPDRNPLAAEVESRSDRDDTVLLWGNFAEIYWAADRAPAAGFVSMDFVTGRSGGRDNGPATIANAPERGYDHLLTSIAEKPPRLIIDTAPAGIRDSELYPIELFPELDRFVSDSYEVATTVDGVVIYECVRCD